MTRFVGIGGGKSRHIAKSQFGTWCGRHADAKDPGGTTCRACWHNRSENAARESNRRGRQG